MPSLYAFPELYQTLLCPEPDLLDDIYVWMDRHLKGDCRAVMDPACGPGTYLRPFAEDGCLVAGNDLEPKMVAAARRHLAGFEAELTEGDMRALRFERGPFDLACNFYSSIGHLEDAAAVVAHLRSVAGHLRPGGLYLLGLTVLEGERSEEPVALFESQAKHVPGGGMAAVAYESVWRDPVEHREHIRVIVLTNGVPGAPPQFVEEYTLQIFPYDYLSGLLAQVPEFSVQAAYAMDEEPRREVAFEPECGDVTLVLRREEG